MNKNNKKMYKMKWKLSVTMISLCSCLIGLQEISTLYCDRKFTLTKPQTRVAANILRHNKPTISNMRICSLSVSVGLC